MSDIIENMSKLTKAVTDMGYKYFDWNVDSGDVSTARFGVFQMDIHFYH